MLLVLRRYVPRVKKRPVSLACFFFIPYTNVLIPIVLQAIFAIYLIFNLPLSFFNYILF